MTHLLSQRPVLKKNNGLGPNPAFQLRGLTSSFHLIYRVEIYKIAVFSNCINSHLDVTPKQHLQ